MNGQNVIVGTAAEAVQMQENEEEKQLTSSQVVEFDENGNSKGKLMYFLKSMDGDEQRLEVISKWLSIIFHPLIILFVR